MMVVPLVLVLLLFATQTLIRLHARSTVAALAAEAARDAAVDVSPASAVTRANRRLRDGLGRVGDEADIEWRVEPDRVEVHVRVPAPQLLPGGPGGPLNHPIDIVASSRREGWR